MQPIDITFFSDFENYYTFPIDLELPEQTFLVFDEELKAPAQSIQVDSLVQSHMHAVEDEIETVPIKEKRAVVIEDDEEYVDLEDSGSSFDENMQLPEKNDKRYAKDEAQIRDLRAAGQNKKADELEKLLERKKKNRLSAALSRARKKTLVAKSAKMLEEFEAICKQAKRVESISMPIFEGQEGSQKALRELKSLLTSIARFKKTK